MALGIALELAEFCYFLLLRAGARLLHFWVCRLVGMVARRWLVNGTSALLHLLRAALESNRTDKFKSKFLFKQERIKESSTLYTAGAAMEFFLNDANMKLESTQRRRDVR